MLLIVEVILTIVAWKRGWGAKALLPFAIAFAFGISLGQVFGGASLVLMFLLDLAVVLALAIMAIRAPERTEAASDAPDGAEGSADRRPSAVPLSLLPYGTYGGGVPRT